MSSFNKWYKFIENKSKPCIPAYPVHIHILWTLDLLDTSYRMQFIPFNGHTLPLVTRILPCIRSSKVCWIVRNYTIHQKSLKRDLPQQMISLICAIFSKVAVYSLTSEICACFWFPSLFFLRFDQLSCLLWVPICVFGRAHQSAHSKKHDRPKKTRERSILIAWCVTSACPLRWEKNISS